MQTREDVNLMKSKLEDATFLFKTVKEFYGDKLESEEMARFIIDFRKRVCEFKSKKLKMAIQKWLCDILNLMEYNTIVKTKMALKKLLTNFEKIDQTP